MYLCLQEGVEQAIVFPLIIAALTGLIDADVGPHAGGAEVASCQHNRQQSLHGTRSTRSGHACAPCQIVQWTSMRRTVLDEENKNIINHLLCNKLIRVKDKLTYKIKYPYLLFKLDTYDKYIKLHNFTYPGKLLRSV